MASRIFRALDECNNDVLIEDAIQDKNIKYFCPVCKNEVIVKASNSKYKCKHFRHKKKCTDDWEYDMSEWHRNWQNCFPKECQEVVMSNGVEIHRADVCINNTVIEFQHSSITAEEVKKRNIFYLSLGFNVIWVFDAKNKIIDLDNNIISTAYPYSKFHIETNNLYWKIKNKAFENFKYYQNPDNFAGISVFLETDCSDRTVILQARIINEKCFESYITYRPIFRENFLVSVGCLFDEKIETIKELIEETQKMKRRQLRQPGFQCIVSQKDSNVRSRLPKGKHRF